MTSKDARLLIPRPDSEPWPTLGPELCDWIEAHLVHGPGDVLGEPVELIDEVRLFLYRAYEVYPPGHRMAGRRRFKRAVYSRRKGVGKTELAAWLAIAEMDPNAPVRCDGFKKVGRQMIPVGRPVRDPYIPMVAVTEEQTEDLAYAAVYEILANCALGNEYDIGLDRIQHKRAPGKIQALASAPSAREGARTTFQHFDETHLFTGLRLKNAHGTMLRNIPKRLAADAWSFETTTMYAPGEESIAEGTHRYAEEVARGKVKDPRLLFDHRQASESWNLGRDRDRREALKEASGDALKYTDLSSIMSLFHDPQVHLEDWCRYWLNQRMKRADKWLGLDLWDPLKKRKAVPAGTDVVLAFDGSYNRDSTALVGCTVAEQPHVFAIKTWEKPINAGERWRTPRNEVDDKVAEAMETWQVLELAPDPYGWGREIEDWEEAYGEVVVRFATNQIARFGPACDDFYQAVCDGDLTHDGNEVIRRHLGNAVPVIRRGMTVITKSAVDSPDKIDAAVGAVVAYHRAKWHHTNSAGDLGAILVETG